MTVIIVVTVNFSIRDLSHKPSLPSFLKIL